MEFEDTKYGCERLSEAFVPVNSGALSSKLKITQALFDVDEWYNNIKFVTTEEKAQKKKI